MIGIIILNPLIKNNTPNNEGIDIAEKIAELGGKAEVYGIISGCAGYRLRDFMDIHRIHFQFVEIAEKSIQKDLDTFFDLLNNLSCFPQFWVIWGTLTPRLPENIFNLIIDFLNRKEAKCILLTEGETLRLSLQSHPFLTQLNKDRLNYIINRDLAFEEEILHAAKSLSHTSKYILISLGSEGAALIGKGVSLYAVAEQDKKIEVGSSFMAAFLLQLEESKSIKEAFGFGLNYEALQTCKIPQANSEDMPAMISVGMKLDDVVCGMEVQEDKSYALETAQGTYYFCSLICKEKFKREPAKYLSSQKI